MTTYTTSIYNTTLERSVTLPEIFSKVRNVMDILYNIGYYDINDCSNVTFNSRLKKALARTNRCCGVYTMDFNVKFFEVASQENIDNVIAHECVHLIPGCWDHKKKFKEVARKLNKYGYNINRTLYDNQYATIRIEERENHIKYIPKCPQCGHEYRSYLKTSKTVKMIVAGVGGYYCTHCNHKGLLVIKQEIDGSRHQLDIKELL